MANKRKNFVEVVTSFIDNMRIKRPEIVLDTHTDIEGEVLEVGDTVEIANNTLDASAFNIDGNILVLA